jgi:hypothetical protein
MRHRHRGRTAASSTHAPLTTIDGKGGGAGAHPASEMEQTYLTNKDKISQSSIWRLHHDIDGQQAICCHALALSRVAASILAPRTIMRYEKFL